MVGNIQVQFCAYIRYEHSQIIFGKLNWTLRFLWLKQLFHKIKLSNIDPSVLKFPAGKHLFKVNDKSIKLLC